MPTPETWMTCAPLDRARCAACAVYRLAPVWVKASNAPPSPGSGPSTAASADWAARSEEHTSELQSHLNLVCRLLLEKKKKKNNSHMYLSTKSSVDVTH